MNQILYVGAGLHIDCVNHFPNTKEFVFVDTQPRSEFDSTTFHRTFYRNFFFEELIEEFNYNGFRLLDTREIETTYHTRLLTWTQRLYYMCFVKLPHINPTLLTLVNDLTGQTIRYYISTNIKYNFADELTKDIMDSDALIVSGYFPHKSLYRYFGVNRPKTFIGYSKTSFQIRAEADEDSIIAVLHNEPHDYFDFYCYVDYNTGNIYTYHSFKELLEHYVK